MELMTPNKPNNKVEEMVKEFHKLWYETDWQEMRGDELVSVDPDKWFRQALTTHGEEERKQGYEQGAKDERERVEKEIERMKREASVHIPKHAAKYDDCEEGQEKRAWTRWIDLNDVLKFLKNN